VRDDLEHVYRQQGERMWRALLLYTGDREVANDAVAEAFAQALHRGAAIQAPDLWVWRAAFRIAAGELKRRRTGGEGWIDQSFELPEETIALLVALPRLSPKQRAAVILHHHGGYSLKEVAEIIGSTPSAVGVHLTRGRRRLRELLGDDDA
jgi:RNA polymerase sigma-70 factor (ECF subfamily)